MRLNFRRGFTLLLAAAVSGAMPAQVIEFESNGLKYRTLTKSGVTVMWAPLPVNLHEYATIQVAIANGSQAVRTVSPEDFTFVREDGKALRGAPAKEVVDYMLDHASPGDLTKLISAYENTLNNVARFRSTNGYEERRQAALMQLGQTRLKAAAAASAIALVRTKLDSGDSTDGAVFFVSPRKSLAHGYLIVHTAGQTFDFASEPQGTGKTLVDRTGQQK